MKKNGGKPSSVAEKRTCKLLTDALGELMKKKPFDAITVTEICGHALIPHSTFYNYFEDKFDLLRFVFDEFFEAFGQLNLGTDFETDHVENTIEKVADYCLKNKAFLQRLKNADANGTFSEQLHDYIAKEILARLKKLQEAGGRARMPADLIAEYYAVNVVYLGRWWLERGSAISMPELKSYLRILFDGKDFIQMPPKEPPPAAT